MELWLNSQQSKISKKVFYQIWEARGLPPPTDKIPVDLDDLPPIVTDAVIVFNSLGDRIVPDIGYIGKDYSSLELILKMREIPPSELLLDILLFLDQNAIKEHSRRMQAERDKIAQKSGRNK